MQIKPVNPDLLPKWLTDTYGQATYLMPVDLDWDGGIDLYPDPNAKLPENFNRAVRQLEVDKLATDHSLHHGMGSLSLGTFPISGDLLPAPYSRAFCAGVILKPPGTDKHRLPAQLAHFSPFIQPCIDAQFASSPYAEDKILAINFRVLPLQAGQAQIGDGWHTHKPRTKANGFERRAAFFGLDQSTIDILNTSSSEMLVSEAYISSACPTFIQTSPSKDAFEVTGKETAFEIVPRDKTPSFEHRQVNPWELVMSTGHTYHTPDIPKESEHNKIRLFMAMAYTHTQDTEERFRNADGQAADILSL